ncbi:hypothetical protein CLV63_11066 [Murinocardiopsis flavida]|uniref:Uncharacterized protein n=1 Tax=Murinocardiopsis flavida TaxID=645275 RepID=A0A2P8DHV4_9ACTN|nr:hypothetical protein [Murinocardiopsis flavida]PSK96769.1 hypothetical protein CLV63_11066 [Murinocardiopsis flavida]
MPEHADREVMDERNRLAMQVVEDLAAAGLPVVSEISPTYQSGVEVTVDPLADEQGGVYVTWRTHEILRRQAVYGECPPEIAEARADYWHTAMATMAETLRGLLAAAGFEAGHYAGDFHTNTVRVTGRTGAPPVG